MADYLVQEDGTSRFVLEDSSGDILLETAGVSPDFIASVTALYAPSVQGTTVAAPFISSVTAVHAPSVGFTGSVTVTAAGTYTWLCPAGVTSVQVQAYGGGGGGGDHSGATEGGGGGGGAFSARIAVPVTPGTLYTFVVGAAGVHAIPGTAGSSSTFTGDSGTQVIAVGGAGGANTAGGAGGAAASCTGDTGLKFSGGAGGNGGGLFGGGGGASGNTSATGNAGATGLSGGAGGLGANGGGDGGHGGQNVNITAGHLPGGGGGGGGSGDSGANGADGQIVISAPFVFMSFIPSVTTVNTPTISSTDVRPPFIDSHTIVYEPTLRVAFTGGGVSQVALEVLTSDSTADAYVSQVTLEIIVPWYKGLHVWEKTGQTGG